MFLTYRTIVWSASTTGLHVSVQDSPGDETFSTSRTNIRSFAGMITFMHDQRGSLRESFATLVARILSLASVRDIMSPEQCFTGETLATHLAGVRFFAGVRSIVNFETFCGF